MNGMAIFGGGGADGNAGGGGVRADGIAIEIGSIGIACVFQLLRQRIPLELEDNYTLNYIVIKQKKGCAISP